MAEKSGKPLIRASRDAQASSLIPAGGLAWRLAEILREHPESSQGRLSLISLEPARQHFGAEWLKVAGKVRSIVEVALRGALGGDAVYLLVDDVSYLVLLPTCSANTPDTVGDIGDLISGKILGPGAPHKILASVLHLYITGSASSVEDNDKPQKTPLPGNNTKVSSNIDRILQETTQDGDEFSFDRIGFYRSPMCTTTDLSVSSIFCRPYYADEREQLHYGYNVLPPEADVPLHAELDALTAECAAKEVVEHMKAGNAQVLVYVPVHRMTLSSRKFRELYLKVCRNLLWPNRTNIILDIYGIEEGTPINRVAEHMQWLRPYAQGISATVGVEYITLASFSGLGLYSVGADLSLADLQNVNTKLARFTARVREINTKCHMHGVNVRAVADLCLSLMVDTIDADKATDS